MNTVSYSRGRERTMSKRVKSGLILTVLLLLAIWIHNPLPPLQQTTHPIITARTKATMEEKRENRRIAREYSRALGYTPREAACLDTLWAAESRFDHLARPRDAQGVPRSSAYGIAQLLGERSGEPAIQILHGLRYLDHRFGGSACRALSFHKRHGFY